jgi:NitT/TauT family transport system ATP-binding protein
MEESLTQQPAVGDIASADKVRIEDVDKAFSVEEGGTSQTVRALDQISMTIANQEVITLTGMSGCGKTTLLRVLMGLETVSSGQVLVDGHAVNGPGEDRAIVFQHAELLPWRSALGNVEFALEARGIERKRRRSIANEYLELVGLGDAMDRMPYELSGGMRQRVGMARALATEPEVLLMDEPFGSLDAQTRETLQLELLRIQSERAKTIVFVTHDLDEAVLLADRVVMMAPNPGRIHALVDVDIPRPRLDAQSIRASSAFADIRKHLWQLLQQANNGARADEEG